MPYHVRRFRGGQKEGMKVRVYSTLLLVLLGLSIMPLHFPFVVDSGVIVFPRNPPLQDETYVNAETNVTFTWTSRWQPVPQEITNCSSIAGDHVFIRSSWDIPVVSSNISIRSGFNETREGKVAEPTEQDFWPSPLCCLQGFSWETFVGIHSGNNISVNLNLSHGGDPAFDIYHWTDADHDNEVDLVELEYPVLLAMDKGAVDTPESGSFRSRLSKPIAIRIYCWTYAYSENMTYDLQIDTREEIVITSEPETPTEIMFDTYYLLGNTTAKFTLISKHGSDVTSIEYTGVTIGNYFSPVVNMNPPIRVDINLPFTYPPPTFPATPILQGRWNLTWTCYDLNANDTNYFSVWMSSDDGFTFQLLEQNLTETFYVWDSTGFIAMDHIYRVRAYSLDFSLGMNNTLQCSVDNPPESYWPGDYADSCTEGWQSTSVPTPSTTVTTSPTPTTQPQDGMFLYLAVGLGGVIIIILGILLMRKK